MTAAGFATFENVCYLTANGAEHLTRLVIRGFGTGSLHSCLFPEQGKLTVLFLHSSAYKDYDTSERKADICPHL